MVPLAYMGGLGVAFSFTPFAFMNSVPVLTIMGKLNIREIFLYLIISIIWILIIELINHLIFKHALRNAVTPVITYVGPMIAFILTGSLVVEKIFAVPGLGKYFYSSIINRDYPMIMGTTIFLATIMVIMTLISDILYKVVDPRVDLS
jgi:ABC-type microcin C transport system permease subunit YejB